MIYIELKQDFSDTALLEHAARLTLEAESASVDSDITIVLTDDAQLRELNRNYLGVDAPTDVLSFPADETDPESGNRYLGDILISVQRAAEQAQAAGIDLILPNPILFLLVMDQIDQVGL